MMKYGGSVQEICTTSADSSIWSKASDVPSPVRVIQIAPEGELPEEMPPLQPVLVTYPTNLPGEPTPFIGREREIDAICDLLRRPTVRLLTLTGTGGWAWGSGIARGLNGLGAVAAARGDYERATALSAESLRLWREVGDRRWIATMLGNLGLEALEQGDLGQAKGEGSGVARDPPCGRGNHETCWATW